MCKSTVHLGKNVQVSKIDYKNNLIICLLFCMCGVTCCAVPPAVRLVIAHTASF